MRAIASSLAGRYFQSFQRMIGDSFPNHNQELVATRRTAPDLCFFLCPADERFAASMGRACMGRWQWWRHAGERVYRESDSRIAEGKKRRNGRKLMGRKVMILGDVYTPNKTILLPATPVSENNDKIQMLSRYFPPVHRVCEEWRECFSCPNFEERVQ